MFLYIYTMHLCGTCLLFLWSTCSTPKWNRWQRKLLFCDFCVAKCMPPSQASFFLEITVVIVFYQHYPSLSLWSFCASHYNWLSCEGCTEMLTVNDTFETKIKEKCVICWLLIWMFDMPQWDTMWGHSDWYLRATAVTLVALSINREKKKD